MKIQYEIYKRHFIECGYTVSALYNMGLIDSNEDYMHYTWVAGGAEAEPEDIYDELCGA